MTDYIFKKLLIACGGIVLIICIGILISLITGSLEAFNHFGIFNFIFSTEWNPTEGKESYGALSFITGTLFTSVLALLLCIPFSLPVALFIGEYHKGKRASSFLSSLIDLLAGIPSIVYGLWGFYTLRPLIMKLGINDQGFGVLTSSIILAIMITPYASSLSCEFISMVPNKMKEAAYGLGATRYEVIKHVVFPMASSGIGVGYMLALGRALGETMAVTMLIGNTNNIVSSLGSTGNTMASVIANQFAEADGLKLSSLIAIGLLLFLISAVINMGAKLFISRINRKMK